MTTERNDLWIPTRWDRLDERDMGREFRQGSQGSLAQGARDVSIELRAPEHLLELGSCAVIHEQLAALQ